MAFLIIPFSFGGANLRHSDMTNGMPAMTAIAGMAQKAEITLQELGLPSLKVDAFTLVYFSLDKDRFSIKRPAQDVRDDKATLPALFDIRRGHGEAALVLKISAHDATDFSRFCELILDTGKRISRRLNSELRFAGGDIFMGLAGEFEQFPLTVSLHEQWSDVLRLFLRAYPTKGQLIQDMSGLLREHAQSQAMTTLDAMMDLLYQSRLQVNAPLHVKSKPEQAMSDDVILPPAGNDLQASIDVDDIDQLFGDAGDWGTDCAGDSEPSDPDPSLKPYLGMLIPTAIGYHEICPGKDGIRYVETVLGLVRARVLRSALKSINEKTDHWSQHFWRWEHRADCRLFRATAYINFTNEA
jgi:hypothetical protein